VKREAALYIRININKAT